MFRLTILFACFFTLAAVPVSAVVVVDYDGSTYDYVTAAADQNYQRAQSGPTPIDFDNDGLDDSVTGITFSDTQPLNPNTANYDTNLPSATFYGGVERIRIDSTTDGNNFDRTYVDDNGNDLTNRLRISTTDSSRIYKLSGVFVWDVGPTAIDLTQDATITADLSYFNMDAVHLAVRNDGQWYVGPQMGLSGLNYDAQTNNFFKPADFASLIFTDMSSGFSAMNLDNVDMIGAYFEGDQLSFNATNDVYLGQFEVAQFTVDAALVPEPGTLAMLLVGTGLVLSRRRGTTAN